MKKILFTFITLTFLIIIVGISYQPKIVENIPNAYEIIKYMDKDLVKDSSTKNTYYLLFDSYRLDTNNFNDALLSLDTSNVKIMSIYPYINVLYQDMLSDIVELKYNGNYLIEGTDNIYKTYMKELEKYRLHDEIDKVLVNGVRIRMIKVIIDDESLYDFLINHKGVKYSKSSSGLFKTLNV